MAKIATIYDNHKWFIKNQPQLCRMYRYKYLLIYNCEVVDTFESKVKAYFAGIKRYGKNFNVQYCIDGEEAYVIDVARPWGA